MTAPSKRATRRQIPSVRYTACRAGELGPEQLHLVGKMVHELHRADRITARHHVDHDLLQSCVVRLAAGKIDVIDRMMNPFAFGDDLAGICRADRMVGPVPTDLLLQAAKELS